MYHGRSIAVVAGGPTIDQLAGDPHPHLAQLRAQAPLAFVPALDGFLVVGRDVALAVLRDGTTFTVDDPRFTTARVVGPSMLSTDGGLLATGHMTGKFSVYNADTLEELYSFNLGTPITAPPMTYSVGGKQYIAVVAGGGVGVRGGGLTQPGAFVAVFGL